MCTNSILAALKMYRQIACVKIIRSLDTHPYIVSRMLSSTSNQPPEGGGAACEKTQALATKLRAKTPIGKLDELDAGKHPNQEQDPLEAWPDNTNPHTGEVGGPRGPEPTRYGDWERKGRVTDF